MQRIAAMIRKEYRQVFRDRPMVVIIFVVPLLQLLILAHAITTEVQHLKLLVADLDHSPESRRIVQAFSHTERFDLVGFTRDLAKIKSRMQGWEAQMAVVIPPHFGRDLGRGLAPRLQLVADGVDGNAAGVALGYAQGILAAFGQEYLEGSPARARLASVHLVGMEERMWYNPELSSRQYMVPGIVVVLLTILPMMLSALSLVKEKEIGTLEQLLVTPLKKHQLLMGKLIPFLILSYAELALVTAVGVLGFAIPMQGSYPVLALLALLYLFTTLGLGIFISTVAHSQQQAMFVAWFFMIFMILMSGFFIPIENMPVVLQKLTYLNPMRYFMAIVRDIFQKGSQLRFLLRDAVPLAAFGLLIFSFGVAKFRKRVG
jgi:ABC-2 type transport system permease protein